MTLRKCEATIHDRRLLSVREGADYAGVGLNTFRAWAEQIGAVRRIGSRVLYDRNVIDAALDDTNG